MLKLILFLALPAFFLLLYFAYPHVFAAEEKKYQLIYLFLLLLLLGSGIFYSSRKQLQENMRNLLLWGCIFLLFITGYSFKDEMVMVGERIKGELTPSSARDFGEGTVTVRKSLDGHFYLQAEVNGVPVLFLVDTGATGIVLAPHDAQRLGFDLKGLSFNKVMQTANGTVRGASVRLDNLSVSSISLERLPATVNSAVMSESLLGMEFLQRLRSYEVKGDSLFLRSR